MIKLKVCGMKFAENMAEVVDVQPDYMGFIFYSNSSRYFEGDIIKLPNHTKKVGVFVNATITEIIDQIKRHQLNAVQLHRDESVVFCEGLRQELAKAKHQNLEIIKAFSIHDDFDFTPLKQYESVCDYFLFDTRGKLPGGNGIAFNWNILENYSLSIPFFLSGGIGLNELDKLDDFFKRPVAKYCSVIDVNSQFETRPAYKDIEKLKEFKKKLLDINRIQE